MTNQPKVFVLILSYNGKKWLVDCLPSVVELDYPNYEVVVIDNGSTDGTKEFLRKAFPQVHVVTLTPNRGYAGGFNAGLNYAAERGADHFLIMNNDTVIDHDALTALVNVAESETDIGFVTGKVYFYDRPDVFQSLGKEEDPITWVGEHIGGEEKDRGQYDQVAERILIDDIYTLVNRKMYDQIGGYDSQFFLQCEELDWQLRAKKAGWKIYYAPDAKLWHRGSATIGGFGSPMINYFLERSRMIVFAKHGGATRFLRYTAWSGTQALYRLVGGILQLDPEKMRPRLARVLGIMSGLFWLLHRRPAKRVPKLIQHLTDQQTLSRRKRESVS